MLLIQIRLVLNNPFSLFLHAKFKKYKIIYRIPLMKTVILKKDTGESRNPKSE